MTIQIKAVKSQAAPDKRPSRTRGAGVLVISLLLLLSYACAETVPPPKPEAPQPPNAGKTRPYKVLGKWYYPLENARGFEETGLASWYGKKFHGRKTANGEVYDMYGVSAAHKTLPLGTYVRVHHLQNGRSRTYASTTGAPLCEAASSISPMGPPGSWASWAQEPPQ